MRRLGWGIVAAVVATVISGGPAQACGGLVAPNGTVNLLRTSTLAAYHDGVEHYVTSFEFAGGGGKFGSIVPLPDVPTKVVKGGDWTLQRLAIETQPVADEDGVVAFARSAVAASAKVILTKRIDALDITILQGGGTAVGNWARENGFDLPPDAPEVLDFYAQRSPIFMAAVFDAKAAKARGQGIGDGTPVHLTIPTDRPWVPLRILGLGRLPQERIEADVYLLNDDRPALLPAVGPAGSGAPMTLERSEIASESLMSDLRSDRGMKWMPRSGMWLSYIRIDAAARELKHDLAIDPSGGTPSRVDAGLVEAADHSPLSRLGTGTKVALWAWLAGILAAVGAVVAADRAVARLG